MRSLEKLRVRLGVMPPPQRHRMIRIAAILVILVLIALNLWSVK